MRHVTLLPECLYSDVSTELTLWTSYKDKCLPIKMTAQITSFEFWSRLSDPPLLLLTGALLYCILLSSLVSSLLYNVSTIKIKPLSRDVTAELALYGVASHVLMAFPCIFSLNSPLKCTKISRKRLHWVNFYQDVCQHVYYVHKEKHFFLLFPRFRGILQADLFYDNIGK